MYFFFILTRMGLYLLYIAVKYTLAEVLVRDQHYVTYV